MLSETISPTIKCDVRAARQDFADADNRVMQTLLSVQYLRAIAAIAVVVSHCWPGAFVAQAGVDLFFVISGFIMWTLTTKPVGALEYWWHRLARVAPLYWLATVLMALHQRATLLSVVKSALFWPYFGEGGHIWPVMVPGWTINYEIAFYALIGVMLLLPRRRIGLLTIAATLCLLSLLHPMVSANNAPLLTYTNPITLEFLAGIGLAELRLRDRLPSPRLAILLFGLALLGYWWPTVTSLPEGWHRLLVWGLPSLMVATGALACEAGGPVIRVPGLKVLGDASYSIYLSHPFTIEFVIRALSHYPLLVRVIAPTLVATAFGVCIHFIVERPMTRKLHQTASIVQRIFARRGSLQPDPT
jgi:exopolysaccharide production protein ExoZ